MAEDIKSEDKRRQYQMDEEVQKRIFNSRHWRENCTHDYTLDEVLKSAQDLKFIGGVYSKCTEVSPFLCLLMRLLQLRPKRKKVASLLQGTTLAYPRALLAIYSRLVFDAKDCRKLLVDLQYDYEKIVRLRKDGSFKACRMFSFADELMSRKTSIGLQLPEIDVSKVQKQPYYDDNHDIDFYYEVNF